MVLVAFGPCWNLTLIPLLALLTPGTSDWTVPHFWQAEVPTETFDLNSSFLPSLPGVLPWRDGLLLGFTLNPRSWKHKPAVNQSSYSILVWRFSFERFL